MNKIIGIILGVSLLFGVLAVPVLAETTDTSSVQELLLQTLQEQIVKLKAQIEALIAQIENLREAKGEIKDTGKEIKVTLKFLRQLRKGMSGDDVTLLQEMLATDPEIYPEALVTGYFGNLTEKAVKRFQKAADVEQVGLVGPKTLAKINELLEEGAGASGKVPPGLLIAPGIRKKLGFEPQPLPGQKLPPGIEKKLGEEEEEEEEEEDTTPPILSEISVLDVTTSSAMIAWFTDEEADSNIWYDTITPFVITETPTESSPDLVLNHKIAIFGLIPGTVYYYIVNSADVLGNATSSGEEAFDTLAE